MVQVNDIQEKYNKFREKVDNFTDFTSYYLKKHSLSSSHHISNAMLNKKYINYHQVLMLNLIDELETNAPSMSESKIESFLFDNFHTVIYDDFKKNYVPSGDYKGFFNKLHDIGYILVHGNVPFVSFTTPSFTGQKNEIINNFIKLVLSTPEHSLIFQTNILKENYLINEIELLNHFMTDHIPTVMVDYINNNIGDSLFEASLTTNLRASHLSKANKKCAGLINSTLCEKLQNLSSADFIQKFGDFLNIMIKLDKTLIKKPYFKSMLFKHIPELSQNHISYIQSTIKTKDKTKAFNELNHEIALLNTSRFDLKNMIKDTTTMLHSRVISFDISHYHSIFPNEPLLFKGLEHKEHENVRITKSLSGLGQNTFKIEFLTKKELIIPTNEIIELLNTNFPNLQTYPEYFTFFFNNLNSLNDAMHREQNLIKQMNETPHNLNRIQKEVRSKI